MRLAQTIYYLRTEKGMSQGDLADALEVSRQSVSKWETGGATPDLDKLVKMSTLFGVTLDELVTGEMGQSEPQPQPEPAPEPQVVYVERQGQPRRKVVAIVLFALALLAIILCTVLGDILAGLVLSAPFWICGIICEVSKKRPGLWCAWALFFCVDAYLRIASGVSWGSFMVVLRYMIRDLTVHFWVSLTMTAMLVGLVVWTIVSFRHLVQQPTRKVKIRLLILALLFVVMQTAPWLVSKIMHPEGAESEVFMRYIRISQMIGMVSQWTKVYAGCRVFIDLFSIYRWKKQQV